MVGGASYGNDEIPNNLSLTSSVSASGYTVGVCSSSTISGTVPFKYSGIARNSPVLLYRVYPDGAKDLLNQWFVRNFTVCKDVSIQFSASDAMVFTDNPYPTMGYKPQSPDEDWEVGDEPLPDIYTSLTVGEQIQQAEAIMSDLSGTKIEIEQPNRATHFTTGDETSWSIRTLLSNAIMLDAANYYCEATPEKIQIKKSTAQVTFIGKDDYAAPWVGQMDSEISRVLLLTQDRDYPEPYELDEEHTLTRLGVYDFTGLRQVTEAGTLRLVNSLVPLGDESILSNSAIKGLLGKSFGTQFNCDSVKVDKFLTPLHQLDFELTDGVFYVTSASYKLTTNGIYASVSGSGRSLSDATYVGKTEKTLRKKLSLNSRYGDSIISATSGIYWTGDGVTPVNKG